MQLLSLVFIVSIILLCILLAHRLAAKKGLNPVYWGVMAGIFGPLVFPVLLLISPKKPSTNKD